tara:strand:- start:143 stop:943 length:801 start_codon:yes stop_codon:yes gene_type:complete
MSDLSKNLRLLCSYDRSISSVCRRIGISRQQFTKYLSGKAEPTLSNLRRIGDYFGLEVHEMLLEHAAFRALVAIRRPIAPNVAGLSDEIRQTLFLQPDSIAPLSKYLGYYYSYHRPLEHPDKIVRGLCHVYEQNGFVVSRNIERYAGSPGKRVRKYNGIFVHSGDKIVMFEREAMTGRALWLSILDPFDDDQAQVLSGLTLGVSRTALRQVACYRVLMEFLGTTVNLRAVMQKCVLVEQDSPEIDATISQRLRAEILPQEHAFVGR